jgi:uncharacterized membrane protein
MTLARNHSWMHFKETALKVLILVIPRQQIYLTGRFAKLSKLDVHRASVDELMRILGHVGHRLQTLKISMEVVLQLDKLHVVACPNLT